MKITRKSALSLGRIHRFFTAFLSVDKRRSGQCVRCGMCCIKTGCKILELDSDGNHRCPIRKYRPLQCRKYPRTEKELFTQSTCGYKFGELQIR